MGGFKNPRHSFHEKLVRLRRRRRLDLRDRETVRKRGGHFHDIIDFAHALAALNTTHSLTELVVWRFTRSANRMNTLQWKRQGYIRKTTNISRKGCVIPLLRYLNKQPLTNGTKKKQTLHPR